MLYGYAGKLLFVDLTSGTIEEEPLPEDVCRYFIGGTGLGVRVLYERMPVQADPLGPDNILGFVTGPLTATNIPGGGRFTVVTKSPVTGGWADSNAGGFWGPELKRAGFDAVFVSGVAPQPVYLSITNDAVALKDAAFLWGKDTDATEDQLLAALEDEAFRVACIGPAGEACSLMAGIVNEKGRIAARAGVGAVMGSKGLKAIAVRADKASRIGVADPEKVKIASRQFARDIKASGFHAGLRAAGTGGGTSFLLSIGDCPTRNWSATGLDAMPTCENLNSANMEPYKLKGYGCHACSIRCGALVNVAKGPFQTRGEVHRPEYETLAALGTLCLNDNVEAVIKANEICNLYGLDTIAVGGTIAFAMECYENGLLGDSDTDGIPLTWGNAEAVVALTEKIARRDGIGEILADGVKIAAQRIGKGAEAYAMHVGGHRIPYHDPRVSPSIGTGYIADAQPACHCDPQGSALLEKGVPLGADPLLQPPELDFYGDYDKKGDIYSIGAAYFQVLSSGGMCALYAIDFAIPVVDLLAPVTGWDLDWQEAIAIGRRILTLRQAFNAREGLTPDAFKLPKRFEQILEVGPAAGQEVDLLAAKKSYFDTMGWDIHTGMPSSRTLDALGLQGLVQGT